MSKAGFKKGNIVRFVDGTTRPYLVRPITQEEELAWYDSPASKGMGEDGETKLPPRGVTKWRDIDPAATYTVVRGSGPQPHRLVLPSRLRHHPRLRWCGVACSAG